MPAADPHATMTTSTRPPRTDPRPDARPRKPSTEFTAEWREPERTLVDYLAAIWSRKFWIVVSAGVTTGAAVVYALLQPNVYAANASLLVLGNRGGANAAEVAANMLRMGNIGPSQVLSALEVVNSTVVAERVVDAVGPEEITAPYQPERASEEERDKMDFVDRVTDWMHRFQTTLFQASVTPAMQQPDVAVEKFRANFAAWADERASLIKLTYRAGNRARAQRILQEVVQVAVDRYAEVFTPPESRQLVLQKLEPAEKIYQETKAEYEQFLSTHGRIKFTEELGASERAKAALQASLDAATHTKATTQENLEQYRKKLPDTEPFLEEKRRVTEPAGGARIELIKQRSELESKKIDTEGRGDTGKVEYKIVVDQLKKIDTRLEELDRPREVPVIVDNPRYLKLNERIRDLEFKLTEVDHEIPRLQTELAEANEEVKALYKLQHEADRIAEEYTRSKSEFERLRQAKDNIDLTSELQTLGLSSLQPVDDPTLPLLKEGPRRGRIILAGFAAGLLGSMTLIMLLVRMSKTFLRTSEVAVCLGRGDVVGMPWLDRGNVRRFRLARKRGWD